MAATAARFVEKYPAWSIGDDGHLVPPPPAPVPSPVPADRLAIEARKVYGAGGRRGDIGEFADGYAELLEHRGICDPATGEPYTPADVKGWLS